MSKNVTLPADLIPQLEAWGKLTAELFGKLRAEAGIVPPGVPEDQAWFWSKEWQAMEQEADEALAKGEYRDFDTVEDALNHLHS